MPGIGMGMSRFFVSFGRLWRGARDGHDGAADSGPSLGTPRWLYVYVFAAAAAILCSFGLEIWSSREAELLCAVAIFALVIGLLLRRNEKFNRTLAAERRHLHTAVNNIPQ